MKTIDQAVGERIRVSRLAVDMSEDAFARHLGVSLGRLALCEDGQARFKAIELQRACTVLAIRPVDVYSSVRA